MIFKPRSPSVAGSLPRWRSAVLRQVPTFRFPKFPKPLKNEFNASNAWRRPRSFGTSLQSHVQLARCRELLGSPENSRSCLLPGLVALSGMPPRAANSFTAGLPVAWTFTAGFVSDPMYYAAGASAPESEDSVESTLAFVHFPISPDGS